MSLRVGQLPPLRVSLPLGRVELDGLEVVALRLLLEAPETLLAIARVPAAVEDELVRVFLGEHRVPLDGVEAFAVPLLQIGGQEYRLVDVADLEEVAHHVLF